MNNGASFADSGDRRADASGNVNNFAISYYAKHKRDVEFAGSGVSLDADPAHEVFSKQEHLLAEIAGATIWQAILDAGSDVPAEPSDDPELDLTEADVDDAIEFLFGPDERLSACCRAIGDLKPDQVRAMLAVPPEQSALYRMDPELHAKEVELAELLAEPVDPDSPGSVRHSAGRVFANEAALREYRRLESGIRKFSRKRAMLRIQPIIAQLQARARDRDHM